ncbi:protein YIPF5 [Condylostylus longicornis]|uniref:protein YIPF5 n=1 Tax=Condylostylus longicornis TaxID=2530218 RepID=UPI00244DB24E|nr:protein YIPF5 [Condylostylus longicornis]
MTQYNPNDYNQWGHQPMQNEQSFGFEVPDFGQELNFQSFDNTQTTAPPNYNGNYNIPGQSPMSTFYDPNAYVTNDRYTAGAGGGTEFDDEPPLLEELGINPNHIFQKTLSVLNPFRTTEQSILQDTDMAGPLAFCLALGGFLLLSGKVTFSYIYGIGTLGSLAFYCLLSLMATQATVTFGAVVSVLGYCLLPMVLLSGINVFFTIQGPFGLILTGISILWCAISASKLFVTAYSMDHQQVLVAYPCALLYGVFALITIF